MVASLVGTRFSIVSGGLFCVGAIAALCALLPGFVRYRAAAVSDGAVSDGAVPAPDAEGSVPASDAEGASGT